MMKKNRLLVPLVISVICYSWTIASRHLLNTNSWSISIGKNQLLASWKHQLMGDTARINPAEFTKADTLTVSRYICGSSAQGGVAVIVIKNQQGKVVARATNTTMFMHYNAKVPVSTLLNSAQTNDVLSIFFTINNAGENIHETTLLGCLKLN